ncbi:hypothetical protein TWF730_010983 [Orbilia blumenaviensis]|uniref:Heterokaryon incompatibility domain-containing protein n=1 Tax=Orbilia blumenaviensis TaxID=1796055 RepID=A0AAV9UMR2_9PEZI
MASKNTDDSTLHAPKNVTFSFPTLGDPTREIRLLSLPCRNKQKDIDGGTITCNFLPPMTPESVRTDYEYEALSYTSGPEEYVKIRVDERDFEIRQNLASAIKNLILDDKPRFLWIDQICINEANNTERSSQVRLMQEVYGKATDVIVWLGEEEEESDLVFDVLEKSSFDRFGLNGPDGGPISFDNWYNKDGDAPLQALNKLCHRMYWKRVWITQEIILAKHATLHCGARKAPWETLVYHLYGIRRYHDDRTAIEADDYERETELPESPCFDLVKIQINIRRTRSTLADMMEKCPDRLCKHPRDKIYGLLSIVTDGQDICPDYEKDIGQVYFEVIQHWLPSKTSSDLLHLSQVLQRQLGYSSGDAIRAYMAKQNSQNAGPHLTPPKVHVLPIGVVQLGCPLGYPAGDTEFHNAIGNMIRQFFNILSPNWRGKVARIAKNVFGGIYETPKTLDWSCTVRFSSDTDITDADETTMIGSNGIELEEFDREEIGMELHKVFKLETERQKSTSDVFFRHKTFGTGTFAGFICNAAQDGDRLFLLPECGSALVMRPVGRSEWLCVGKAFLLLEKRVTTGGTSYLQHPDLKNLGFRGHKRYVTSIDMSWECFQLLTV